MSDPAQEQPRWALILQILGSLAFIIFMLALINDWLPAWAMVLLGAVAGACGIGAFLAHRRV